MAFPHVCATSRLFFFSPPDKVPHFSRLGDVEVNAGQNASFQCAATGKVSESEPFLLEVRRRGGPWNRAFIEGAADGSFTF